MYSVVTAAREFETEVRDTERKRIRVAFWGVIRALQPDINICYPPSLQLPTNK